MRQATAANKVTGMVNAFARVVTRRASMFSMHRHSSLVERRPARRAPMIRWEIIAAAGTMAGLGSTRRPHLLRFSTAYMFSVSRVSLVICWCLFAAIGGHTGVHAVLQTYQLDVTPRSGAPPYTVLASQAFYGPSPPMKNAPRTSVMLAPDDSPLLCEPSSTKLPPSTTVLVPRGSCTFQMKTWYAQQMGAASVLIYGNLDSRYDFNETTQETVFPLEYYDYDCSYGEAWIPTDRFALNPYEGTQNDPLLSGGRTENLCLQHSSNHLEKCASQSCFLTGNVSDGRSQACCAWDLSIWLYRDDNFVNVTTDTIRIPTGYLTMTEAERLIKEGGSIVLSDRWRLVHNPSIVIIWLVGVMVAILAAYLSATDYRDVIRRTLRRSERRSEERRSQAVVLERPASSMASEESMELSGEHALGFIVMASGSLLILFYFKVYAIVKVMYALGCSKAVSNIIFFPICCWWLRKTGVKDRIVWRTGTEDFGDISVSDIMSHLMGYALGVAWLFCAFWYRHPDEVPFFWIMQNIFGSCMCIMFLQTIKINSLYVAALLLTVAFFYDIFFVFITPLIFKGKSVMITVATSGGPPTADALWCEKYPDDPNCQGGSPLPMLLTIPRILDYQGGASLLGLGDIVLPGLLLSFAARFDAAKRLLGVLGGGNGTLNSYNCPEQRFCNPCGICSGGYFVPVCIAYAVGLAMANVAVQVMNMGQPALLYLVPCCLGTLSYMAYRRKEFADLWAGPKAIRSADNLLYGERSPEECSHAPVPQDEGFETSALNVPSAVDDEAFTPDEDQP